MSSQLYYLIIIKIITFSFKLVENLYDIIKVIIIQNIYKYKYKIILYLFKKKNTKMNFSFEINSIRVKGDRKLEQRLKELIDLNSLTLNL